MESFYRSKLLKNNYVLRFHILQIKSNLKSTHFYGKSIFCQVFSTGIHKTGMVTALMETQIIK